MTFLRRGEPTADQIKALVQAVGTSEGVKKSWLKRQRAKPKGKKLEPWDMTKEQFIANPPEGFEYRPGAKWAGYNMPGGKVLVSDSFWNLDREGRMSLIGHEFGHNLVPAQFGQELEPFATGDTSKPLSPGSVRAGYAWWKKDPMPQNAGEFLADCHAWLVLGWHKGYTHNEDNPAQAQAARVLFRKIYATAKANPKQFPLKLHDPDED